MSWITAADALEELQNLTNPTVQQIRDIVNTVEATTPPDTVLHLYSGDFGGDEAWEIVDGLKASNSNIVARINLRSGLSALAARSLHASMALVATSCSTLTATTEHMNI